VRFRDAALLFLAGAAFFLPALATRDIWQPLESRYAAVVREMTETGDWLVPRFNGEVYADKPPLFLWAGAAFSRTGCGVQGMRVFGALSAAAALVATAALGRLFFSRRAAILGAAALAATPDFAWVGRFGEMDVPLTLLTTLAVYGWFKGGRTVLLFYAAMGLAVLGKGPSGVIVPLFAVLAGQIARVRPASPRAPLHRAWGPAVALAIPALWFVPAVARAGTDYAHELLFHHVFRRVVDPWIHEEAFSYYFTAGAPTFLPWLLVAVPAGLSAWRRRREEPAPAMLLGWAVFVFLLFCAFSTKRVPYLLPIAPALALLAARGMEVLLIEPAAPARRTALLVRALHLAVAAAGALLVAFGLGGGGFLLRRLGLAPYVEETLAQAGRLPGGATVAAGGALLLALALFGEARARRGRHLASAGLLVAEVVLGFVSADLALVPRLDAVNSPRAVTARIDALLPPGTGEVALYPEDYFGAFNLYSRRLRLTQLRSVRDATSLLSGPTPAIVVLSRRALGRPDAHGNSFSRGLPENVRRVRAGQVGRSSITLLVNFDSGR
jgi:4-amino-4-deoxy-L-arabinose transferase-like glycosyltransferase